MYIINVTDYDNIPSTNISLCNYTNNDKNIDIVIPLITIIPCGMSLICLIFLMIYIIIKPLIRKK